MTERARGQRISESRIRRILKLDLLMKSLTRVNVHLISAANRRDRVVKSQQLLDDRLFQLPFIVWSDEKMFRLRPHRNRHNDRFFADKTVAKRLVENARINRVSEQYPSGVRLSDFNSALNRPTVQVMVWAAVTSEYKLRLAYFRHNERVNSAAYIDRVLRQCVVPFFEEHDPHRMQYVYMQDGARIHWSRETMRAMDDMVITWYTLAN